jgi:uncharacterized protein (TIGR03083 family)
MEEGAMDRDAMWRALDRERAELADLVATLPPTAWARPSLCAGWTVREVVAHLTLGPHTRLPAVLVAMTRARGNFNRMVDTTARQRAELPVDRLVADLRGIVGSRRLAPGQKLADALMDVLVHGQDITVPLGIAREMPPDAAVASAEHLWHMGFPFHTRRRLAGFRFVASDVDWSAGDGAEIRGPITALLPLLAGRTAALPRLTGAGVPELAKHG